MDFCKTLTIFDIETTGYKVDCVGHARIIELTILAIPMRSLNSLTMPRMMQKLVMLFRPGRCVMPDASKKHLLDNEMLSDFPTFCKDDAEQIRNFLKRCQQPICMVAHNGFDFDYPILIKHLNDVKVPIDESIKFVDSWVIFKEMTATKHAATHRLSDIYEHLSGQKFDKLHKAESDCECLLQCILYAKRDFFAQAENHWKCSEQIKL